MEKKTPVRENKVYSYDTNYPESFVRKIHSLDENLKKYNEKIKMLRSTRKETLERLAKWMEKKGLEEYKGIKLENISSKPKKQRITKKYKKRETMRLFSEMGVQDPEDVFKRLEMIDQGTYRKRV